MTIFSSSNGSIVRAVDWFLVRDKFMEPRNGREGFTLGEIRYGVLDSQRICYTVEDFDKHVEQGNEPHDGNTAIGTGRYRITIHQSPHHGHVCIRLHAVPGCRGIEVNALGSAEGLRGCIAVGDERLLDGVRNCTPALTRLITELRRMTMQEVAVYLNVMRAE